MFVGYSAKLGKKTITTLYDPRRKMWRLQLDGRETFYNSDREMMEWDTEAEAIRWFDENQNSTEIGD